MQDQEVSDSRFGHKTPPSSTDRSRKGHDQLLLHILSAKSNFASGTRVGAASKLQAESRLLRCELARLNKYKLSLTLEIMLYELAGIPYYDKKATVDGVREPEPKKSACPPPIVQARAKMLHQVGNA